MPSVKNKNTKIALVSSVLPATNYSTYLIGALQKKYPKEIEALVYTSEEKKNLQTPLKNIRLVWSKNVLYIFQILKQVARDKPKIVHLQHEVNMFGGLMTAAIFPILPILLKLTRVKVVTTIHAAVSKEDINEEFLATFFKSQKEFLLLPIRLFFSFLYKTTGVFSDKIIVHTKRLKSILVNDYQLQKNKVVVMPHGVPNEIKIDKNYQPLAKWAQTITQEPFILTYGYLHKRKGIEVLLESFEEVIRKFPELTFVVAGGALQKDYEQELKELVKKLGIEKDVIFTGFVDKGDLRGLLEKCQFVLLPAKYSISASGPLAQTIAHHKPVIASDIGVFSEEINSGMDGLLAKNTPDDWTKKIKKLLTDEKLYQKIVDNLKKKHQERRWSEIARITYNLYLDVLKK